MHYNGTMKFQSSCNISVVTGHLIIRSSPQFLGCNGIIVTTVHFFSLKDVHYFTVFC